METLLGRNGETNNGLYWSSEPTIFPYNKSLDAQTDLMGTEIVWFQFQNYLRTRHKGRQARRFKQAAGVPPWRGSYASRATNFETSALREISNCRRVGDTLWTAPTGIASTRKGNAYSDSKAWRKAQITTKGSKLAAGHDLYSIEDILIPANSRALVKIGLAVAVPEGTYGRIAPRSGLATKSITVDEGVIDADYRGEVKVLLVNHGKLERG